jgi:hypothetical protein
LEAGEPDASRGGEGRADSSRAVTGVAWLEPGGAMVCGQSIGEKQNRFVVCFFVIGLAGHFCIFFLPLKIPRHTIFPLHFLNTRNRHEI